MCVEWFGSLLGTVSGIYSRCEPIICSPFYRLSLVYLCTMALINANMFWALWFVLAAAAGSARSLLGSFVCTDGMGSANQSETSTTVQ